MLLFWSWLYSLGFLTYAIFDGWNRNWSPCLFDGMGFSVKDDFFKVQGRGRSEKQVFVFQGLGEEEAFHAVNLFHSLDAFERGIASVRAAMFDEVLQESPAHFAIPRVIG